MKSWFRTNKGLGLCLAIFMGVFYYVVQRDPTFHRKLYDGFSLGFFPTLSIIAVAVFSLVLIFDGHRDETMPEDTVLSWTNLLAVIAIFGGGFAYVRLLPVLGFPIATPIYLLGIMFFLGMPARVGAIIAMLIVTALAYLVFLVLGFPLPLGILGP